MRRKPFAMRVEQSPKGS